MKRAIARPVHRAARWLSLLLLALGPGCGRSWQGHDILLVTIDTARADHFSYAADSPVSTPNVDRLAAEGVGFVNAVAPTPITLPSHATLFTGLDPPRHGVRSNGSFRLTGAASTLAEVLSEQGYATAAFVGAAVLDRRYGLDQGFSHYDDLVEAKGTSGIFQYPRRSGERVIAAALDWLGRQPPSRLTFVWVHLFDPHAPYDPPEPERSRHPGSRYAAGVAYADRVVGHLLDGYRQLGRYDDTVVVLTSDHGESLGEHGEATHGVFLYEATLRVPLVLRGPGVRSGRTVERQVGLVDVMPTLLALVGLTAPRPLDGVDLAPLLEGGAEIETPPLYLESHLPLLQYGWSPLTGLRTGGWKLISGVAPELYDLERDPHEVQDLAASQGARMHSLRRVLESRAESEGGTAERVEIDAETRARLEALGYLTVTRGGREDSRRPLPDPRERIGEMERMREAARRYAQGDLEGGIAAARAVATSLPENLTAWTQLGDLLSLAGRYENAVAAYRRAAELDPLYGKVLTNLGFCLERLGRPDEALDVLARVERSDPEQRRARGLRWGLLQRIGRGRDAAREAREALAEDGGDGDALLLLALERRRSEGAVGVVAALESALAKLPGDRSLTVALAAEAAHLGELERAAALYRQVLESSPTHQRAAAGLGRVLLIQDRVAEALAVVERAAGTLHPDPDLLLAVAEARTRSGQAATALPAAERAVSLRPDRGEAWAVLGSVRLALGNDRQAADAYRQALLLDPEDRISGLNLATALERLGLLKEALETRARYQGGD